MSDKVSKAVLENRIYNDGRPLLQITEMHIKLITAIHTETQRAAKAKLITKQVQGDCDARY